MLSVNFIALGHCGQPEDIAAGDPPPSSPAWPPGESPAPVSMLDGGLNALIAHFLRSLCRSAGGPAGSRRFPFCRFLPVFSLYSNPLEIQEFI